MLSFRRIVTYIDIAPEVIWEAGITVVIPGPSKRNFFMVDIYIDQEEAERLSWDSRFHFNCHSELACFNQCCQNPTVILKPYDILRLRKRLGITSTEFLERYTTKVLEDKSRLPLVMLDIDREEGTGCPFLEAVGCGVYEDRPGACRLFPVTQGSSLGEAGVTDSYFIKQLNFCQGFSGRTGMDPGRMESRSRHGAV